MKLYQNIGWVIIRPDNGYPVHIYGADQEDLAKHIAKVNDYLIVQIVQKENKHNV